MRVAGSSGNNGPLGCRLRYSPGRKAREKREVSAVTVLEVYLHVEWVMKRDARVMRWWRAFHDWLTAIYEQHHSCWHRRLCLHLPQAPVTAVSRRRHCLLSPTGHILSTPTSNLLVNYCSLQPLVCFVSQVLLTWFADSEVFLEHSHQLCSIHQLQSSTSSANRRICDISILLQVHTLWWFGYCPWVLPRLIVAFQVMLREATAVIC